MVKPRINSFHYSMRRGSQPRKLKEGDEKYVKGVLLVRQQMRSFGRGMVSNGRPVWEWVVHGSDRDRNKAYARYRTMRTGPTLHVPEPPAGWKILESGRPVPEGSMVFIHEYPAHGVPNQIPPAYWRLIDTTKGERFGMEATYEGERRAFAIPKTKNEILRDYFESGCVCILERKIKKQPVRVSANVAVKKYMARCTCSRHPERSHATPD